MNEYFKDKKNKPVSALKNLTKWIKSNIKNKNSIKVLDLYEREVGNLQKIYAFYWKLFKNRELPNYHLQRIAFSNCREK